MAAISDLPAWSTASRGRAGSTFRRASIRTRIPCPTSTSRFLRGCPIARALSALLDVARSTYALPAAVPVIAVPGSEIAIGLLPHAAPAGKVAIVAPTYGSHAPAWRAAGRDVVEVGTIAGLPTDARIVILANPNNPDGRITTFDMLDALAERLAQAGGLLVVDEAFADVAPDVSLAPHLAGVPALILRSFGKFFGLAGLRLGFVAGPAAVVTRLAALLGDWPVSGPALAIGTAALSDVAWQNEARAALRQGSSDLRRLLTRHNLASVGGTDLFTLVDDARAAMVHRGLAERGIWTRIFAERPDWLRFGLPPGPAGLARLDHALGEVLAAR